MSGKITLGCGCEVLGVLHDEVPDVAVLVGVERFVNFCMKHVMTARLTPRKRARQHVHQGRALRVFSDGGTQPVLKLCREKVPGHALWWFVFTTGEQVSDEGWRAWHLAHEESLRPAREAQAEAARQARLRDEGYLLAHFWTREGEDAWTVPEEIQVARAYRGKDRYVRTTFKHAFATQKLIEREDGDLSARPRHMEMF